MDAFVMAVGEGRNAVYCMAFALRPSGGLVGGGGGLWSKAVGRTAELLHWPGGGQMGAVRW